jgi:long-subunit fatty acid transport protein
MNYPLNLSLAVRRLILVLAFLAVTAAGTQAQIGGAAAIFLQIEPDSRAAGMGNSGVALADNASAIFWNPAGLADQRGAEFSLTHAQWLPALTSDLFYEYLVGKYHIEGIGTVGGHVTFLNLGRQEWRDENNVPLGEFRSYELAVGGSYGMNVTRNLSLGTSLRFIYSNLAGGVEVGGQDTKAGVSVGVDLAALYRAPQFAVSGMTMKPTLGINLANMGPTIQYSDAAQSDPIPTNLRFGAALRTEFDEFNALNLALDFNKLLVDRNGDDVKPFYQAIFSSWGGRDVCLSTPERCAAGEGFERVGVFRQLTVGTGAEYWYNNLFALRTGLFYEDPYQGNRKFLTFGAGIRYNIVGVDFSYIYPMEEDSPLANTMRFSVLLNMGR